MSDLAKWCPECGTLNPFSETICNGKGCAYFFRGGELGSSLDPVTVDTESKHLEADNIRARLLMLPGESAKNLASRKEDVWIFLARVGVGLLIALFCGICLSLVLFSGYNNYAVLGIIALFGCAALLSGIVMMVRSLLWFLKVPKFATAEQIVNCFYGELVSSYKGSVSRAWSCLDSKAKEEFNSLEDFKKYWKRQKDDIKQWALDMTKDLLASRPRRGQIGEPVCAVILNSIQINNVTEQTADISCQIMVSVFESVIAGVNVVGNPTTVFVYYKLFALTQSKTLLKGPDRWYLTSGTLDGPNGWRAKVADREENKASSSNDSVPTSFSDIIKPSSEGDKVGFVQAGLFAIGFPLGIGVMEFFGEAPQAPILWQWISLVFESIGCLLITIASKGRVYTGGLYILLIPIVVFVVFGLGMIGVLQSTPTPPTWTIIHLIILTTYSLALTVKRKAEAQTEMDAIVDESGWVTCPNCQKRFSTRSGQTWVKGYHKTCGQKIKLVRPDP